MRVKHLSLLIWVGLGAISAVLLAQSAAEGPTPLPQATTFEIVRPSQLRWTDPPAGAARGTPSVDPGSPLRYASIHGDPLKPDAPFAIRLKCSDGYKAAPHWHPVDENIVVLQGIFSVGTGDRSTQLECRIFPLGAMGLFPAG